MKNLIIIAIVATLVVVSMKLHDTKDRLRHADATLTAVDRLCEQDITASKDGMYISGLMRAQQYIRRAQELYTKED